MTKQHTRAPEAPGDAAMRAMFAARKRVFVDLLNWDLPVLEDRYELDQFDTSAAEYLILLGEDGQHRASARLLPTEQPHLLGDIYPALCKGEPLRGPGVWEISRFCVDPDQTADERRSARDELVTALTDYALGHGITDYVGVADTRWFKKVSAFGWVCEALGDPSEDGCCQIVGLRIRIDADTIKGLERAGTYVPLARVDYESGETVQ